ncbi:MAG: alpha/beta fold hydrolase, partial [Candidatus Krumholzibacteria bacterium]|nr:alpha/beta fold hydrolase [Candidatus Krumholzibacteria bacterium]
LFPAVLLITGSGAQDRNELIFGHKPFLLIADFLTRAGIAVLRVDDRGVGGSTRGLSPATTADLVQDVLRGVRFLREHPGTDPEKVGLIGHSEGGLIAPMAAAESNEVVFIVMLAGTGVPGMEILLEQTMLITKAAGATQEQLEAQWEAQRHALSLVAAGADSVEIREAVANLIAIQQARQPEGRRLEGETLDDVITGETRKVLQPWFRYFLILDPRTALRSVQVPVLALNGELDLQVPPYQNLPEIEKALKEAGNTDVTIREFPGLNHLFQTTTTGSPAEYAGIEETMSPEVLETIRDWILARFRKGGTR